MRRVAKLVVVGIAVYVAPGPNARAQVPPKALQNVVADPEAALQRFDKLITDKQSYLSGLDRAAQGVAKTPNLPLPGVPAVGADAARALGGEMARMGGEVAQESLLDAFFGNPAQAIYDGYRSLTRASLAATDYSMSMAGDLTAQADAWMKNAADEQGKRLADLLRKRFAIPTLGICGMQPQLVCQSVASSGNRITNECIVLDGTRSANGNWNIDYFARAECVAAGHQGYEVASLVAVPSNQQRSFVQTNPTTRTWEGGRKYASFCLPCGVLEQNALGKGINNAVDEMSRGLFCGLNPKAAICAGRKGQ